MGRGTGRRPPPGFCKLAAPCGHRPRVPTASPRSSQGWCWAPGPERGRWPHRGAAGCSGGRFCPVLGSQVSPFCGTWQAGDHCLRVAARSGPLVLCWGGRSRVREGHGTVCFSFQITETHYHNLIYGFFNLRERTRASLSHGFVFCLAPPLKRRRAFPPPVTGPLAPHGRLPGLRLASCISTFIFVLLSPVT